MPIGGFIRRPGRRMRPPNESRERQGNIGVSIRRPPTADHDRRMDLTRTGHIRRFHSAVSEPPIKPPFQPERLNSVRYERRFRSAVGNRRSKPQKNSRSLWSYSAVSFRGQAAERDRRFTKIGETKGEAKGILQLRSSRKNRHPRCMRGRFRTTTGNELQDT